MNGLLSTIPRCKNPLLNGELQDLHERKKA